MALTWQTSFAAAKAAAIAQNKLIVLVGGRDSCGNCRYMYSTTFEQAAVRNVVDLAYVPWKADLDRDSDWEVYESGMGDYGLPLIVLIDPLAASGYIHRYQGIIEAPLMAYFLQSGITVAPPRFTNLANGDTVSPDFVAQLYVPVVSVETVYSRFDEDTWTAGTSGLSKTISGLTPGTHRLDVYFTSRLVSPSRGEPMLMSSAVGSRTFNYSTDVSVRATTEYFTPGTSGQGAPAPTSLTAVEAIEGSNASSTTAAAGLVAPTTPTVTTSPPPALNTPTASFFFGGGGGGGGSGGGSYTGAGGSSTGGVFPGTIQPVSLFGGGATAAPVGSSSGVSACGIVDALAYMQYDIIRRLNRKFAMLRRLAQLLEELGNLSDLVPNINSLIPVLGIDLSAYNQLAAACPFLGLPSPGEASLNSLRAQVIGAYSNLARGVLNHPWMRMGKLQEELTKFQNKISAPLAEGQSYLQCLQAACNAVSQAGSAFRNISQANIQQELSTFSANYVNNAGQVMTEPMRVLNGEAQTTYNTLRDLGAETGTDYRTLRAQATATPSSFVQSPTVVQGSGIEYANPPFVR